jgi:hypothetical protein
MKRGRLLWVLVACLGLELPATKSSADTATFWVLNPAVVHKLEARIVMPEGAKPIGVYTRYYEPGFDHGRRTVFGVLTEEGDKQIHIGHQPMIMDGGCSVLDLTFDVATNRVTSINCHGVA